MSIDGVKPVGADEWLQLPATVGVGGGRGRE